MAVHLAKLNENLVCTEVKTVKEFIDDGLHVEIPSPDFDYYSWKKYENGAWSLDKFIPDYAQIKADEFEQLKQESTNNQLALAELHQMILNGGTA